MSARTTPEAIDAFTKAVTDDCSGRPGYSSSAIVVPANIGLREFLRATTGHDVQTRAVVFVREDGAQMIMTPHRPLGLRGRFLSAFGVTSFRVEVRPADDARPLYRAERLSRGPRDLVRHEHRVFAGAC